MNIKDGLLLVHTTDVQRQGCHIYMFCSHCDGFCVARKADSSKISKTSHWVYHIQGARKHQTVLQKPSVSGSDVLEDCGLPSGL
jgi:hypothetical protein